MTNKEDKPHPDKVLKGEPPPASSPVRKANSEGRRDEETPVAANEPEVRAGDNAPPPRQRLKRKTDVPMKKNSNADLQARQDVIGAGLKRIFDEIVEEPIPPEFLELLNQIDLKREP
jgi:Anti-sigma factor NepR